MVTWADVAGGVSSVEHAIDPAMSAVPAGTVTGPGQAAPTIAPTEAGVLGHFGQLASDFGHGLSQEGLMGLLDPVGMMDRQEAQHELRGNDASGIATEAGLGGNTRDRDNADVQRWEHQAVGLGTHEHDATPNENAYRRARAAIGATGGATALPGDAGMAQRASYD